MAASAQQPSPDLISAPLALYLPPEGSAPIIVVCTKESHGRSVTWTSNPVESGAPVTDHARPEPQTVSFDCIASKTPIAQNYTNADDVWQQLSELQGTPALITIVSIGGLYENVGVESVSRAIDVKSANAVAFTLTGKVIRIVRNKLTQVVRTAVPKGQPKKKVGAVMTFTLDEAEDRGALEKIVDAVRK